ncbi:hypothetical protein [Streptococcus pneumoniae]|uniref:hypothetical protein n=1 Tax=Streptococcus pneumoniae TaxID=1313 RepID=UPI0015C65202|nr:hypothetical protein [Streptococcus pneumoniae]
MGCLKQCFEVVDRTRFEVVDRTDEGFELWIELTKSNLTYGRATMTWFEEIFEEYE